MQLSFFGAAREVTGSCYLLETGAARILIDCGMFQGSKFADDRNHEPFPFDPSTIDAVLVTHAHLDHTGRIPKLVRDGFRGRIFATAPTAALAGIIWDDTVEVMTYDQKKSGHALVYTQGDAQRAREHLLTVAYDVSVEIGNGITATWHDAGHILGSAFIEINAIGKRIVFSGDLGNRDVPILRACEPLIEADAVIMESTYGAHLHEDPRTRKERLREAIARTVKLQGVLLIPAFAVERIQEILYELNTLVEAQRLPTIPVFLDSPLAIRATDVFEKYPSYYDAEAYARVAAGDDLFNFPGLRRTLTTEESRTINDAPQPKVIIAGAGMMTGGRIYHHLRRYLPNSNTTILIVGYQAERTLGRKLLDGTTQVEIYGERVPVRATIEKLGGYSAHADRGMLLDWLASAPTLPKRIFLVHGDPDAQDVLSHAIHDRCGMTPTIPTLGQTYEI